MKFLIRQIKRFVKATYLGILDTVKHDGIEHAGYLSFLLMLTIFPFLVFFVAIAGFIGSTYISDTLVDLIIGSSWAHFIDALKPRIIEITSAPPQGLLTIAVFSTIWTASSIFEATRTILNRAYRVQAPPPYILRRLLSIFEFMIVIFVTFIVMLTLVVLPSIWSVLYHSFTFQDHYLLSFIGPDARKLRYFITVIFTFCLISFLYYSLPNKRQVFYQTFPGTVLVITGWSLFTITFRNYISSFHQINVIYGSLAGMIISLIYFYICSIIFIFGAEFNYHMSTGKR